MRSSPSPHPLSLREIASWQFPELASVESSPAAPPIAALPSLQRGAVWRAGQVEMLWDSILRGFPVGSFVVCPKFPGQAMHRGRHGAGWPAEAVTHFLLDGQQRANAIALAFRDALAPGADGGDPAATLWIDLAPGLPPSSTRRFCLRVLTASQPWGFGLGDDSPFLGVAAIREAVRNHVGKKRPRLVDSWPHFSGCPVPFRWLLDAALLEGGGGSLWGSVWRRCQETDANGERGPWLRAAIELLARHLEGGGASETLDRIEGAVRVLGQYRLVALELPQEVLSPDGDSDDDADAIDAKLDRIHHVEHLFQRLNSAGTVLRGEELLFSMVKAYWPDIENSFAELTDREGRLYLPMPGSRLATLGIRAALTQLSEPPALQAGLSIPQVRAMAAGRDAKSASRSKAVRRYLGIGDSAKVSPKDSDLHGNLRRVDEWLIHRNESAGDIGLPPALVSHLAQGAPEVYLLLLHLAQETRRRGFDGEAVDALRKPVLALATCLHWFGCDAAAAARRLVPLLHASPLRPESFDGLLVDRGEEVPREALRLLDPDAFGASLRMIDPADRLLQDWTRWREVVSCWSKETEDCEHQESVAWPLWERLLGCRPLLLFAQRGYISRRFCDFDPSCVDVCEGRNRPWDYDHLLPANVLYRNQGVFRDACRQWSDTIGNLRAWPLEENRSRHDEVAETSIPDEELADSLLEDPAERLAFSLRWEDLNNPEKCAAFMNAARSRTLRLYRDWYEALDVGRLFTARD
jgi:hypothetical protein